jgi:hypothetical protein
MNAKFHACFTLNQVEVEGQFQVPAKDLPILLHTGVTDPSAELVVVAETKISQLPGYRRLATS